MSPELDALLRRLEPAGEANRPARLRFGLACCERVAHLLEQHEVLACVDEFRRLLGEGAKAEALDKLAQRAAALANRHQGSKSLDGVGHAAVSATYASAMALQGKARQAAEYAAYAMVYGQGGYGATGDPQSFEPEFAWQAAQLRALLDRSAA